MKTLCFFTKLPITLLRRPCSPFPVQFNVLQLLCWEDVHTQEQLILPLGLRSPWHWYNDKQGRKGIKQGLGCSVNLWCSMAVDLGMNKNDIFTQLVVILNPCEWLSSVDDKTSSLTECSCCSLADNKDRWWSEPDHNYFPFWQNSKSHVYLYSMSRYYMPNINEVVLF